MQSLVDMQLLLHTKNDLHCIAQTLIESSKRAQTWQLELKMTKVFISHCLEIKIFEKENQEREICVGEAS